MRITLNRGAAAVAVTCSLLFLLAFSAFGQDVTNGLNVGFPPSGSFAGSDFDNVQLNNGNLHMEIPLWTTRGRGLDVSYKHVYDSKGWAFRTTCNRQGICTDVVIVESGNSMQWKLAVPYNYIATFKNVLQTCSNSTYATFTNYVLREPSGTKHHFMPDPISPTGQTCWPTGVSTLYSDDGSGWIMQINSSTGAVSYALRKDGTKIYPGGLGGTEVEDSNGNELIYNASPGTLTDTLGRTVTIDGSYYDSSGTLRSTVVTRENVNIQTNQCLLSSEDFCNDYAATWSLPQVFTLPNGMTYTFTYDLQGGPTHPYDGEPLSVTLPTGGQITWTWSGAADGGPFVVSRTLSGDPAAWQYSGFGGSVPPGYTSTGTQTDPAGNDTQFTCTSYVQGKTNNPLQDGICFITKMQYYKGSHTSGTLLKTVVTDYENTSNSNTNNGPVLPIRDTTTWNDTNQVSKVETDWDSLTITNGSFSWQNPTERREFDYGSGVPGTQIRTTDFTYLHLTNSTYRTANIANKVTSKIIHSGSSGGATVAQTNSTYDGVTTTATSGAPNHDYTNFGTSNNIRGNLTQIGQWFKRTGSYLNTNKTYNDLGDVLTSTDPGMHQTMFDYTDSWQDSACSVGANSAGYVTKITDAAGHQMKHSYFTCTGLTASTKDQNDINNSRSGTTYIYDLMDRLSTTNLPDGGLITNTYTDTVPVSVQTSQLVTTSPSTLNVVKTKILDGLGRLSQTQLQDPDCTGSQDTADYGYGYDPSTNTSYTTQSNPYCGTSTGTMKTSRDALGRMTTVLEADGSQVSTTYSGNTATGIDEVNKKRKSQTDGLGRVTFVWEDPTSLNYETDYVYDVLDNLTSVTQKGGGTSGSYRIRTFTYDSLSRLTCAANPEVTSGLGIPASCPTTDTSSYTNGTIQYNYDADGNVLSRVAPAPNQTSVSSTVQTNYSYDAVHRLTQKSYTGGSPSTPTVKYGYDGITPSGCTPSPPSVTDANPVNNRTSMCDGAGASAWSHDEMGRIKIASRLTVGTSNLTRQITSSYNKDGSLATLLYPSSHLVTYTPNSSGSYTAGRPVSAKNIGLSENYVTNATYAPQGALKTLTNGTSIYGGFSYNSRLQPLQLVYTTGTMPDLTTSSCPPTTGNIMHRVYHFGVGSNDNGNVQSIDNCRATDRTQNFLYDNLNRITNAWTTGTNCCTSWGEAYTIDAWGNLTNIAAYLGRPTYELLNAAPASIKNQLNGFCNDAAGNLVLNTGNCPTGTFTPTHTYDGENRLVSTAGWTYSYDGDGNRIKKCNSCSTAAGGTLYWSGSGTDPLVETNLAGTLQNEYVFFNGKRVVKRDSTNTISYYMADHLGSTDVVTAALGTIKDESDYYPFGGENVVTNTLPQNYKFTGKERDTESGLDMFGARYYGSSLGRFMTPDWAAKPTAVPYAMYGDPQSLNLYSYEHNNPAAKADPDGHCGEDACVVEGAVAGVTILVMATQAYYAMPPEQRNFGASLTTAAASVGSTIRSWFHSSDNSKTAPQSNPAPGTQTNTGPTQAPSLPDDANVVRGGSGSPGGANSPEGIAAGTGTHPSGVTGFSAESAPGKSVEELSKGVPNGQVGCCTVGEVRAAGGDVVPTSGRSPNHATVTGLSPAQASGLLTPTVPNPAKAKPKDKPND